MNKRINFNLDEYPYFLDYVEQYKNKFLPIHNCKLGILPVNDNNYRLVFMKDPLHRLKNIEDIIFIEFIDEYIYFNFETESFFVPFKTNLIFNLSLVVNDSRFLLVGKKMFFNKVKLPEVSASLDN